MPWSKGSPETEFGRQWQAVSASRNYSTSTYKEFFEMGESGHTSLLLAFIYVFDTFNNLQRYL